MRRSGLSSSSHLSTAVRRAFPTTNGETSQQAYTSMMLLGQQRAISRRCCASAAACSAIPSLFVSNSWTATLSSSSSSSSCLSLQQQRRLRSARYGVKSDEDHIAERNRNAALQKASHNKKKEDLYEFTGMVNNRASARNVPLGMDSSEEGDRNVLKANPLLILRKVDEDKGGKIVKAIKKIQGKPDSMQLTEEQQSDLVNAYAETKWFAVFWRPFANVNYSRAKRFRLFANIGLGMCIAIGIGVMFLVSYGELLTFCELEDEEQVEYRHIILNVPIGVIKALGDKVLAQVDPNETLTQVERARIILGEMRKLGWHTMDWEVEAPRMFKPWYETWDFYHVFFWCSMWIGKTAAGGGAYYSPKNTFGKIQQQATKRKEEAKRRESTGGFVGSATIMPHSSSSSSVAADDGAPSPAVVSPLDGLPVQQKPAAVSGAWGWLLSK